MLNVVNTTYSFSTGLRRHWLRERNPHRYWSTAGYARSPRSPNGGSEVAEEEERGVGWREETAVGYCG